MSHHARGNFEVGRVELPWSAAFAISRKNIEVRLGRAAITGAGIMLGIAFLMSVFTSAAILKGTGVELQDEQKMRNMWLVIMSLLVCGVGITNSMFMSVTERFREIGTMKCLGAVDGFVVRLFLIESALMGLAGSLVGSIVGFLVVCVAQLLKRQGAAVRHMDWGYLGLMVLLAMGIGAVLSIMATIAPAVRAARLPPAAALRTDV
jgi:putative ABC transport system permease protein